MKKSQRMKVVLELAERETEQAAQLFQKAQSILASEREKVEQLKHYYHDYEMRFQGKTTGLRASDIQNNRALLQQIVSIQQGQSRVAEQAEREMIAARDAWMEKRLKSDKLQELIAKYKKQEQLEEEKREQKNMDDWILQTQSHKPSGNN